jgi:transglutaminase-like putative cysteine protease
MRLRVEHQTTYSYDEPIFEGQTEARLRPTEDGGQRCLSFHLSVEPQAPCHGYRDRHGNDIVHFDVLGPYDKLVLVARSEILTADSFDEQQRDLSLLDRFEFSSPTAYTPVTEEIRAFAAPCLVPGSAGATASKVMAAVRERLAYETGATDVTTSAHEALLRGRGVCQDFAHLMLAACRSLGMPARYVSGYVHAPDSPSSAASHAWVDVFLPVRGWISLDPTHDTGQTERHVRLAVGRDYADVPPTRGVFKGNAREALDVKVRIETI